MPIRAAIESVQTRLGRQRVSNRHRVGNPKERLAGVYTTTLVATAAGGASPRAKVPTTQTAQITGRRERLVARTQ
jgi:hypothetical protein